MCYVNIDKYFDVDMSTAAGVQIDVELEIDIDVGEEMTF